MLLTCERCESEGRFSLRVAVSEKGLLDGEREWEYVPVNDSEKGSGECVRVKYEVG